MLDDLESIGDKMDYAIGLGLGVGFWALSYENDVEGFWEMVITKTTIPENETTPEPDTGANEPDQDSTEPSEPSSSEPEDSTEPSEEAAKSSGCAGGGGLPVLLLPLIALRRQGQRD